MKGKRVYREERKVALFVDGPNMLRKEFMVDLRELRKRMRKYGRIVIAKLIMWKICKLIFSRIIGYYYFSL